MKTPTALVLIALYVGALWALFVWSWTRIHDAPCAMGRGVCRIAWRDLLGDPVE